MSKKNKRKWWQLGLMGDDAVQNQFSNTIKQHNRKFDEDGIEILEEDDITYHDHNNYNYDWNRKLITEQQIGGDRREVVKQTGLGFAQEYTAYQKTGVWGGYSSYQEPLLSYKYVQQMANALSARHMINVVVGTSWEVDLLRKKLTYNPGSLIYGTKSELLATLMHEIGKLRYMTHHTMVKNKYISMYGTPATEVLACFEDVRVDFQMLRAYEGATEIYESAMPAVEVQAKKYQDMARSFEETFKKAMEQTIHNVRSSVQDGTLKSQGDELMKMFGIRNHMELAEKTQEIASESDKAGNIYHYCAEMLRVMYDLDTYGKISEKYPDIGKKVEETLDAIEPGKKTDTSQDLVNLMDKGVYPFIEKLLKDFKGKEDEIKKHMPDISPEAMKMIQAEMGRQVAGRLPNKGKVSEDQKGKSSIRNSGPSEAQIPPEWFNGDYKVLKDSVMEEIRQLVNRLTFLRREEMTVRYEGDQKRGKLNAKKLYKAAVGSRRVFKTRLENVDTIQSFAFSVLLDVSGSMSGPRIVHSTRAMIIFAEVFKKLDIPFELVVFDDDASHVKTFDQVIDKSLEKKIGGIVKHSGGSTNLRHGLNALKLKNRDEKNKIAVIISDGGVGNIESFDASHFIPWERKGIKSLGIGIECEAGMAKMCQGNSKVLKDASQMPVEFAGIIKQLIKRR